MLLDSTLEPSCTLLLMDELFYLQWATEGKRKLVVLHHFFLQIIKLIEAGKNPSYSLKKQNSTLLISRITNVVLCTTWNMSQPPVWYSENACFESK